ncbi:hypothetical protein [Microbacterium sp. CIAB417]|uniref:hypothetical protein n=1 Tax=Microbacterium sp. CIAB417 TaxID=2860287 RepID=UPI001FAD2C2B|nr:hypothetical protein [Microbacterium sp. CIAB417]
MISFSGDLWSSLGWIALVLAVIAAIVGVAVWRSRRRGSRTVALDAGLVISGWWVMLSAVGMVLTVVKIFTSDWAELDGATSVGLEWPSDLPCAEFGAAGMLTCSGSELSSFTVGGASLGLRVLAAAAQLCATAMIALPGAMLAAICFQTLRGRPFSHTVTRALTIGAVAVLVLGVASDLLGSIAATAALREVFDPGSEWYPTGYRLTVTPLPFVGALGLLALAAVFREGMRLQAQKEMLERETEGLV